MENQREISLTLFKESGIANTPMNWHIWKRAFDSGVNKEKENTVDTIPIYNQCDNPHCKDGVLMINGEMIYCGICN